MRKRQLEIFASIVFLTMAMISFPIEASCGQWKPNKPITVIVPEPPGVPYDVEARLVATQMSKSLGVPVIVKNSAGGGMMVGTLQAYMAKPDGYTILYVGSSSLLANEKFFGGQYDYHKFVYLATVVGKGMYIGTVTTAKAGLDTWKDCLKLSRPFRWAMAGKGSLGGMVARLLTHLSGMNAVFLAGYSGGGCIPAVMRGEADGTVMPWVMERAFFKSGDIVPIAMVPDRNPECPNVPTWQELGYKDVQQMSIVYHFFLAPPGTPANIAEVLENAAYEAAQSHAVRNYFVRSNQERMLQPAKAAKTRANVDAIWAILTKYSDVLQINN